MAAGALAAAATLAAPAQAGDELHVLPVFRLAMGPAFHLDPVEEKRTEIALDVTVGASARLGGDEDVGFILTPEAGYTLDGIGLHAFQLTAGIGYGHPLAWVSYNPRLILGGAQGDFAPGMRNGIMAHVLADMGSLEIAHQFVSFDDELHHDVRFLVGVNPAAFVYLISMLGR